MLHLHSFVFILNVTMEMLILIFSLFYLISWDVSLFFLVLENVQCTNNIHVSIF